MRIASQGYPYILFFAALGLAGLVFPQTRVLAIVPLLVAGFVTFFFRDPERKPPEDVRLVVSPADGRVVHAGPAVGGPPGHLQVSIFLSLFDVHINRSPISATITGLRYTPGRFLPAYRAEASFQNEQNEIALSSEDGDFTLRQIAGVVARRIVFFRKLGDRVERGERIGLIQFGSRVDVVFPPGIRLLVAVGDKVKGGESALAERS